MKIKTIVVEMGLCAVAHIFKREPNQLNRVIKIDLNYMVNLERH
jgi:hypothetical protein